MKIYVVGIHTGAGKTHFSAAFCEAFGYDYFKLIQAGSPKDSDFVAKFSPKTYIFKEGVFMQTPASPHAGKKLENLSYKGLELTLPQSENLLIETAGGLFTPLDEKTTMIDYIVTFKHPCVLVGRYYLGSINHTLLSLKALDSREIPLIALVMMGERDEHFDSFIQSYAKVKIVHLPFFTESDFKAKSTECKKAFDSIL
ncbi:dethiobiotin synthase [Helicobacter turcicus]|uniref:ATP-dependent dethiobiotin synthetase BioD n=1 Tax=Helicobacter turcicus TaxID=2867412 RepID=A0ABS7JQ69_9HELI|nr:ATP-dependent dethiobiotin synthetase BioD [Helicobacter turcicus]MBX7491533.1 dethiobiotin synthase [Helicobacter turcicus]MBX7546389.1 dethiobiotin synthase [Helicobacter turcicus]